MPKKDPPNADEFARLFDALGESIVLDTSDEEVLAELREAGEDPEALAEAARQVIGHAIRARAEAKRRELRQSYEANCAAIAQRKHQLPATAAEQRALLSSLIMRNPGIRSAVTLHHRELRTLSDYDVRGYLEKLAELGLLEASGEESKPE